MSNNSMESNYTIDMALLRAVIGALGETREQPWWRSSFFTQNSEAFLTPLFPRTQVLASVCAVTEAASSIHDEHIGIGDVHHLFRLPESLEQRITADLQDPVLLKRIEDATLDNTTLENALQKLAPKPMDVNPGPILLGSTSLLDDPESVALLASCYHGSLKHDVCVYPYFGER